METLFGFVIVIVLLAVGLSILTALFGGGGRRNKPLGIALHVARWILLATLLLAILPLLLLLTVGIWLLSPKGRIWSSYWGHVLANATTGFWHRVFGPPKVQIHRAQRRGPLSRKARPGNWRN